MVISTGVAKADDCVSLRMNQPFPYEEGLGCDEEATVQIDEDYIALENCETELEARAERPGLFGIAWKQIKAFGLGALTALAIVAIL